MNYNSLCGRAVCLMDALCSRDVALPTFWHFGQKLGIIRGQLFLKPWEGEGYVRLTTRKSYLLYHYYYYFCHFCFSFIGFFYSTLNSTPVYFHRFFHFPTILMCFFILSSLGYMWALLMCSRCVFWLNVFRSNSWCSLSPKEINNCRPQTWCKTQRHQKKNLHLCFLLFFFLQTSCCLSLKYGMR